MKKKIIFYSLIIINGLSYVPITHIQAKPKNAPQSESINSQKLSFSTSVIFDKETLKKEVHRNPHLKQVNKNITKVERKQIRKQFETLVHYKDAKALSCQEIRQAIDWCLQLEWNEKALLYLQEFSQKTKDAFEIEGLKLEIADLLFEMGNLIKAEIAYDEYLDLYPGSKYAEYAHYKKTICLFYQTLQTDQDQGPTRKAIQFAQSYLEKGSAYQQYQKEIKNIYKQCQLMLFENEKTVFDFYMKRKNYSAAQGRLAYLQEQYLHELPHLEPDIISLECKLAQAQGDQKKYTERLTHLHKKFPEHNNTIKVAQKTSHNYATRF